MKKTYLGTPFTFCKNASGSVNDYNEWKPTEGYSQTACMIERYIRQIEHHCGCFPNYVPTYFAMTPFFIFIELSPGFSKHWANRGYIEA